MISYNFINLNEKKCLLKNVQNISYAGLPNRHRYLYYTSKHFFCVTSNVEYRLFFIYLYIYIYLNKKYKFKFEI